MLNLGPVVYLVVSELADEDSNGDGVVCGVFKERQEAEWYAKSILDPMLNARYRIEKWTVGCTSGEVETVVSID